VHDRHLEWEGCFNARDLGGLTIRSGRTTRWRSLVRADSLDDLTPHGWAQVEAHGIRTIIDLRNDDERRNLGARPASIDTIHIPLDGVDDREFWHGWASGPQFGTPLYYLPHLERFPERSAAVLSAIACARPGGVIFHCMGGRDRTGQIAMLVLAFCGASADTIAADYALSAGRLRALYVDRGEPDQAPILEAYLADRGETVRNVIARTLATFDFEELIPPEHADAIRARLL
jgi:hypothetical protein